MKFYYYLRKANVRQNLTFFGIYALFEPFQARYIPFFM